MGRTELVAVVIGIGLSTAPASAHYHILLPDRHSAETDAAVPFTLRFGHPFEHQMFAAQRPKSVIVRTPDGEVIDLTGKTEAFEVGGADGKPATAYRWSYTPRRRGDHV